MKTKKLSKVTENRYIEIIKQEDRKIIYTSHSKQNFIDWYENKKGVFCVMVLDKNNIIKKLGSTSSLYDCYWEKCKVGDKIIIDYRNLDERLFNLGG